MKEYTVWFSEPVPVSRPDSVFNYDRQRWEDREVVTWLEEVECLNREEAVRLMLNNREVYVGSSCVERLKDGTARYHGEIAWPRAAEPADSRRQWRTRKARRGGRNNSKR